VKQKIRDRGIIFKISHYSESSLILKTFTRDRGLISILAKGMRKKPEASLLNPLNGYEFVLYEPQEAGLYLLGEFSLQTEHNLAENVESWAAAECALELYTHLIIPQDENSQYYGLLIVYLDYLQGVERNAVLVWWRFLLRVLILLGVPFDPLHCSQCHLSAKPILAFEKGTGALVCAACLDPVPDPDHWELLGSQASLILGLLPMIGDHLNTLCPDRTAVAQLNQLFSDFYASHFNKALKLRSLEVLEQFYA
jgi:DNA repair protein RecO